MDTVIGMNRNERRLHAKNMQKKYTKEFIEVPRDEWPPISLTDTNRRLKVLINREYLVQIMEHDAGIIRLSVNLTQIQKNGHWKDGIAWEALQGIKDMLGYSDRDAVEVYPCRDDIIYDANMRHLWVLPNKLDFAWRKGK